MFKYAQLNNKSVIAVSYLSGEVVADDMVLINNIEVEIGSMYDSTTQTFTPPIPIPIETNPTTGEQILAETQYQTALLEMQMLGGL